MENDRVRFQVEPKFENTIMEIYNDKVYFITPSNGYKLHHNSYDFHDEEMKEIIYGFSTSSISVPIDYDFEKTINKYYDYVQINNKVRIEG